MRTNTRKLRVAVAALILAALLSFGVSSASPGDLYVDDDPGCGGNLPCYPTITEAVNAASTGDTIHVAAGTYTENNISVADKRISVVGAGSDATHLYIGSGYGFKITAGGSTPSPGCIDVSGFDVYGAGRGSGHALFFETGAGGTSEADKCTWENNKIHDMKYGVKTNDRDPRPQYWAFRNNEYYEIRIPLLLEGTYYVDIVGNTLKDYKEGVEMNYGDGGARHWLVMDNEFSEGNDYCPDCKAGIILSANARDIVISGNVIMDSPAGILVPDDATIIDLADVGINGNCIMGNDVGLDDQETSSHVLDAENNYWGCADGPGNPGCDTVFGLVDYDPWATKPIKGVCAPPPPDHFLFYKAKVEQPVVELADQFETGLFEVEKPDTLGNPADKEGLGITDPETHLVGYKIKPARGEPEHVPVTGILVENQFGELFVDTVKPDRLLVPTLKDLDDPVVLPEPFDPALDHYKCYKVQVSEGSEFPKGIQVSVVDQFEQPKLLDVKKPTRLCIPVDKDGKGIKNPDSHLMCYAVKPAKGEPKHVKIEGIHVNNQFGPGQSETQKEEELCVPSEKILP